MPTTRPSTGRGSGWSRRSRSRRAYSPPPPRSQLPMGPAGNSNGLIAEAATIDVTKAVDALLRLSTPDYLKVMRIPLLRGRGFGPQDVRGAPRVMIVSQELARRLWPGRDPIGKRVACCEGSATDPVWKTVIGVAGDVRSRGLGTDVYPGVLPSARPVSRGGLGLAAAHDGRRGAVGQRRRRGAFRSDPRGGARGDSGSSPLRPELDG